MILLQIVLGSPGTHLVKNQESQSATIEWQFKKQWVPGSFVTTQSIWRQTPKLSITVYWNKNILLLLLITTKTKRTRIVKFCWISSQITVRRTQIAVKKIFNLSLTRRVEICWLCGHNMLQSAVTSAKTSTHGETDVTNAHLQLNMSTGDNSILGSQSLTQDREKTTKSKTKSVPTRNSASQSSSANKSTTKSSAPHTSSSRSTD